MEQEALHLDMGDYRVSVPDYMKEIVAEITHHARQSPDVNQRSGVSVRASVANYEALLANAFRRALRVGETEVVPRISDLPFILPSLQGKVEFEAMEDGQEDRIMDRLMQSAVKAVFDRNFDVQRPRRRGGGVQQRTIGRNRRRRCVATIIADIVTQACQALGEGSVRCPAKARPRAPPRSSSCSKGCTCTSC